MDRLEHEIELYLHRRISRAQLLTAAAAAGLSSSALLPMIQAQAAALPARPKQSARGPARITFIKGPHSPNEVAIEQRLIAMFEKQHPGIKVNFTMYQWPSMDATLEAAYASPTPPDVAYLVDMVYPKFASAGALENLAPYVSQASYQSEIHAFLPAIWGLPHLLQQGPFQEGRDRQVPRDPGRIACRRTEAAQREHLGHYHTH